MNAVTPITPATDALGEFGPAIHPDAGISAAGIYDLTHEEYHLDPCAWPSLSCSIAKMLIRGSAKHAWQAHPRFGNVGFTPTAVMDDGSTMHAMLLGQAHLITPIRAVYGPKHKLKGQPVADYKTGEAQEERDEIRALGQIPVLHHRLPELLRCKAAVLREIQELDDGEGFLAPGRNEVCVVAREDDVLLRCLVDRLPDEPHLPPFDLKFTELSVAPGASWERRLQFEYAFQDAFYTRVIKGARAAAGVFVEPEPMRFIAAELDPPHGTAINAALPELRAIAAAEVERAIQLWRLCTRTGEWPRYGRATRWIGPTAYQLLQAEDAAQVSEAALRERVGAPANWDAVRALRAA
jgi:hypothetical protein